MGIAILGHAKAKNAFAPVLGGGRFTQPGADGGERLTQIIRMMRVTAMVQRITRAPPPRLTNPQASIGLLFLCASVLAPLAIWPSRARTLFPSHQRQLT